MHISLPWKKNVAFTSIQHTHRTSYVYRSSSNVLQIKSVFGIFLITEFVKAHKCISDILLWMHMHIHTHHRIEDIKRTKEIAKPEDRLLLQLFGCNNLGDNVLTGWACVCAYIYISFAGGTLINLKHVTATLLKPYKPSKSLSAIFCSYCIVHTVLFSSYFYSRCICYALIHSCVLLARVEYKNMFLAIPLYFVLVSLLSSVCVLVVRTCEFVVQRLPGLLFITQLLN